MVVLPVVCRLRKSPEWPIVAAADTELMSSTAKCHVAVLVSVDYNQELPVHSGLSRLRGELPVHSEKPQVLKD